MNRSKLVALVGAIGVCLAAGAVNAERTDTGIEAKRLEAGRDAAKQAAFDAALPARMALVQSVIAQYSPQILADPQYGPARLGQFAMQVHQMRSSVLESARIARNAAEFTKAAQQAAAVTPKNALGDQENLVFLAIGPCRIADSRISAGGALVNNVDRSYLNFSAAGQGGTAPCNQNSPGIGAGTPGAIALNLTVTGATHQGFVTVRPPASTVVTSAINFLANQDIANAIVVKMSGAGGGDFEARPGLNGPGTATVQVIFDLLGFYVASEPAALDCVTAGPTNTPLPVQGTDETDAPAPACAAGYTFAGVLCSSSSVTAIYLTKTGVDGTQSCSYINLNGAAQTAIVRSRCCRVPGNTSGRI